MTSNINTHLQSDEHRKLTADGWSLQHEFCHFYTKDNAAGFIQLSAADWENAEFDYSSIYMEQMDDSGNAMFVIVNGATLDAALEVAKDHN
jgi:hypothetical protein